MGIKNLEKKIMLLEKKLTRQLTHLAVIIKRGESSKSALLRVMNELRISKVPDSCFIINLNFNKKENK